MIDQVLLGIVAAMIYAGSTFLKNNMNPENPEGFDQSKFMATMIVGAFVGLLIGQTGVIPTETAVAEQLLAYSGIVAVMNNLLKIVIRQTKETAKPTMPAPPK